MRFLAVNFSSSKAVLPRAVTPLERVKRVFCKLVSSSHINMWNDSDHLQSGFELKHTDFFLLTPSWPVMVSKNTLQWSRHFCVLENKLVFTSIYLRLETYNILWSMALRFKISSTSCSPAKQQHFIEQWRPSERRLAYKRRLSKNIWHLVFLRGYSNISGQNFLTKCFLQHLSD